MAIQRTDIGETDEERESREEREAAETARQEELETARREKHDSDLARAKAEGEAEALRRGITAQPTGPQPLTEAQWQVLEQQNPGRSREDIMGEARRMAEMADARMQPMLGRLEQAEKEAREAKEEARKLKGRKTLDSVQDQFFKDNVGFAGHRDKVDEFLSAFPDAEEIGPDVLKKRLDMARDYVKGRVKEKITMGRQGNESGSGRMELDEENDRRRGRDEDQPFNPSGTGNDGARRLMESVHSSFGNEVSDPESVEVWKKSRDEEDRGVSISSEEDVARARALFKKDVIGSTKGR